MDYSSKLQMPASCLHDIFNCSQHFLRKIVLCLRYPLITWKLLLLSLLRFSIHQYINEINCVNNILQNYSSIITVHPEIIDGRPGTMAIESFVVDVPEGNTKDETCYFVEALIKCNLKSLADVSEHLAVQGRTEPIDRV